MMTLREAVEKYLSVAGDFGRAMPLSAFGLGREETEAMLAAWDEDYQLHRHLELIPPAEVAGASERNHYMVGGMAYDAILIRQSIRAVIA
jgi:hypothetical protein